MGWLIAVAAVAFVFLAMADQFPIIWLFVVAIVGAVGFIVWRAMERESDDTGKAAQSLEDYYAGQARAEDARARRDERELQKEFDQTIRDIRRLGRDDL